MITGECDNMIQFYCRECTNITDGADIEIKKDSAKRNDWMNKLVEHQKYEEEKIKIKKKLQTICDSHNSHWYNFLSKWGVTESTFRDFIDIIDFNKRKIVMSEPFKHSVLDFMLTINYRPMFNYIECPVCHCKTYVVGCD